VRPATDNQLYEQSEMARFVNSLNMRVLRAGHGLASEELLEAEDPVEFSVKFEPGALTFTVDEVADADVKWDQVQDLMRVYVKMKQQSIARGEHGALDDDEFQVLLLRSSNAVVGVMQSHVCCRMHMLGNVSPW
jgi:hypothetical protein